MCVRSFPNRGETTSSTTHGPRFARPSKAGSPTLFYRRNDSFPTASKQPCSAPPSASICLSEAWTSVWDMDKGIGKEKEDFGQMKVQNW